MRTSPKTLVFYVTLLVAVTSFILVNECNAQRGFGRLPFRQQQIENRVRQITPEKPASDQKPTPAAEEKAKETPAPAVNEKAAETPAPAAEEKAKETPAPAAKEKTAETPAPAAKKKAKETPSTKKKAKDAPAVKEKSEASILEEKTTPPAEEKKTSESDDVVPDLDELLSGDSPKTSSDPIHEEAVEKVLANPDVPEEAKAALKQATKEDIQKSVEEATAEVEADNRNEHIDGVVENSRKEVDEDAIETAVNEVLESSDETLKEEEKRSKSSKTEEEVDDSLPDSLNQVIDGLDAEKKGETAEADAGDSSEMEESDDDADDDEEETDEAEDDAEADADAEEAAAPSDGKKVKMDDLDQELKVPENATFDQLHAFLTGLDSITPADLDQTDQEVLMNQAKTFIEKVAQAKLAASNQMLALEGLTDEQWEEAVSWKVQSLVHLFQFDGKRIDEMRDFVKEVSPQASKEVSWKLESILIQMELAQITEEPTPEDLKKYVNRMLDLTQKGIDDDCVSLDFVLATVQMVALTEDALPKEESKEIFESAIKTLNSSETPKLKEMAKFLQKILDQREIVGKTPDLTLETYDGKTVKTADFAGKTLLIYCFQMSSRDQLQDLGLVYQIYLVFHERGLEVLGIVPEEKTDAMDELLKQIPWPMVFEGKAAENSSLEKLCVPTLPVKVLVNTEGKIENANVQPMELLKYLEAAYGPVSKSSDDEEAKEDEGKADETEAINPPADDADDELPDVKDDEEEEEEDAEDEEDEDGEDEALDPPADEAPQSPVKKVKEKVKEKAEEKLDGLDLDLDL